jgi:DNA (cytosine-5)-methyltransferase 1
MHDLALPSSGCASGAADACLFGLSLCSGAGGLDLGLAIAIPGYRAVGHVERETFAAATLVARMEDAWRSATASPKFSPRAMTATTASAP